MTDHLDTRLTSRSTTKQSTQQSRMDNCAECSLVSSLELEVISSTKASLTKEDDIEVPQGTPEKHPAQCTFQPCQRFQLKREASPQLRSLLPPKSPKNYGKKTLVLDLDNTLVYSSFIPTKDYSFIVPATRDGVTFRVFVSVRPYTFQLLSTLSAFYEIIIFTAASPFYALPVIRALNKGHTISHALFRNSCVILDNDIIVKDISLLGRDLRQTLIVDDTPTSYYLQPENAISVSTWPNDVSSDCKKENDSELQEVIRLLSSPEMIKCKDIRKQLREASMTREMKRAKCAPL